MGECTAMHCLCWDVPDANVAIGSNGDKALVVEDLQVENTLEMGSYKMGTHGTQEQSSRTYNQNKAYSETI